MKDELEILRWLLVLGVCIVP